MTESPQQHGGSQDLLSVVSASTNDALKGLALREVRRGNCGGEALASGLPYLFLTCGGSIDNVVTPPRNHQTGSMRAKPPNVVV